MKTLRSVVQETATFLEELAGSDVLPETDPDWDSDAERLAHDLRALDTRLRRYGEDVIHELHPLVVCGDCGAEFTACDAGNHYCPSCGTSADEADLAVGE